MNKRSTILYFVIIIALLSAMSPILLPDTSLIYIPLHASSMGCEGILAITAACFLLLRDGKYPWKMWMSLSLAIIGILTLFHSTMEVGDAFTATDTLGHMAGAVVALGVWHGKQFAIHARCKIFLTTIIFSIIGGVFLLFYPPDMFDEIEYRYHAISIITSCITAIAFVSTAVFFAKEYAKYGSLGTAVFLYVCSLNAAASVTFCYCTIWNPNWWAWNGVHIVSKMIVISYMTYESSKEYFELKETEKILRQSNDDLVQFAYVASHDLKSPLRAISNLSTWIAEDVQAGKDVSELVALVKNRINRMESLINGLLEFSRIGRTHTECETVDLQHIVEDICESNGIKINIPQRLPIVKFNPIRIEQVFSNLIGNSIKHHHDPKNIKISVLCQERANKYELSVKDNGPGIASQYHKRVFEIFQTLRPKDETEGTGIGLSLVKKIVEENDGEIWLESQEGTGCKFTFTIPK